MKHDWQEYKKTFERQIEYWTAVGDQAEIKKWQEALDGVNAILAGKKRKRPAADGQNAPD